jgi:hypothetical protein
MRHIIHTPSPLAVMFVALAAVLALSSTTNAKRTAHVRMH